MNYTECESKHTFQNKVETNYLTQSGSTKVQFE